MGCVNVPSLLIMCLGFGIVTTACPTDWQQFDKSCYFVLADDMSWYTANRTCRDMHASLSIPDTEAEQTFIWDMFLQMFDGNPPNDLWIGCNAILGDGTWKLCPVGQNTNGFQNWNYGEPDEELHTECAVMKFVSDGKWHDQKCTNERFAVCELKIVDEVHPSTQKMFCLQTGSDGRITSQCLFGHVIKELPAKGVVSCDKACRSEPRCRSFNLLDQGLGETVCQLNDLSSQEAAEEDMKEQKNCFFFEL